MKGLLNHTVYKNKNSNEWVTFVHGAGGSSSIWFKQIRAFNEKFNVLVLDLRGHGKSGSLGRNTFKKYTFDYITSDIINVINHLEIEKSHFIGISLGTILIRNLAEKHSERVSSMIFGGAIMKMNVRSQFLIKVGVVFKSVVPYMLLYKLFAFIIMPKNNHKKSRLLFINEAKKMCQKEFIRWFRLTSEVNPLLKYFRAKEIEIPTLYIMGEEDYLFLPSIRKIVSQHTFSKLIVVENTGHVVNVEQPRFFNEKSIQFIGGL